MADVQEQVQSTIDQLVESGAERGIQVAVFHAGSQIVDAVAGTADPATGRPVDRATPFYNYSVGKGATATIAHMQVEKGLFGYDTRVVELWPEFGAHGKEGVTVRHVLTHSAGVPGIPADTTIEDLCDWDHMCAAIADAELWWEPGTQVGYHAYTFGYLVGEIVRRATGRRISQLLADEVAGPLGVAGEIYFGMPVAEQGRLAVLEDAPMPAGAGDWELPPDSPMAKAGPPITWPNATFGNRQDTLAADIPAGGKTSARAIARMYAALLGDVDGVRLIPEARLQEATAVAASGIDQVFGNPSTWCLGWSVGRLGEEPGTASSSFGMGGMGGSFAYGDKAKLLSLAVTKNVLSNDFETSSRLITLVNDAV
jgi:CubicO group peptidase (beta-lactamase class C family)